MTATDTATIRRHLEARIEQLRESIAACEVVLRDLGDEIPRPARPAPQLIRPKGITASGAPNAGRVWPDEEFRKILAAAGRPVPLKELVAALLKSGMDFSGRSASKLTSVKLNVMKNRGLVNNGPHGWFLTNAKESA